MGWLWTINRLRREKKVFTVHLDILLMEMNNDFSINIPPKNGQNADAFNEFKQTTIYDQNLIEGINKKVKGLKVKLYINFIFFP